jgi:hypothetical protein
MASIGHGPQTRLVHQLITLLRHNMDEAERFTGKRELVLTDIDLDMFDRWPDEILKIEAMIKKRPSRRRGEGADDAR